MGFGEWRWGAGKEHGGGGENREHFKVRPLALSDHQDDFSTPAPQTVCPTYRSSQPDYNNRHQQPLSANRDAGGHRELTQLRPERRNTRAPIKRYSQQPVPCAKPSPCANKDLAQNAAWQKKYNHSVKNIQDHIYAVAGAVSMLDSIEHKILEIKYELQRIRETGRHVDCEKVLLTLECLTEYVNAAIRNVDGQCINLLKDAKMEIRFAELGREGPSNASGKQSHGVSLTMISISNFLDVKIKSARVNGLVEDELPQFIEETTTIISSNIQILTSVMLALFATRDYTQAVTKLAARENIIPKISEDVQERNQSSTVNRIQIENMDQHLTDGQDQLKEGRTSLAQLLEQVRENRRDESSLFSNS